MKLVRLLSLVALIFALVSCKPLVPEVTSQDCIVPVVPAGFTRIFIGAPVRGGQQSGTSETDPLDGTSADKFDTILRTIAEGQQPTWGTQKNIAQDNLIACIASGTFQTNGQYDWDLDKGRTQGSELGFTVEKNWKIHGMGVGRTKIQLASYIQDQFVDDQGEAFTGGRNIVISTRSNTSSGVEVSDLTIDANHDQLAGTQGLPLTLSAILLRSHDGGHWIHNVMVTGASGDAAVRSINYEAFAVHIWGNTPAPEPHNSINNLIENVTITKPGRAVLSGSPPGGLMDGIAVNNVGAEIRNNIVEGYYIGYGGWTMDQVSFHDNTSRNTYYGFNADALTNTNITLKSNQFLHPVRYGIIMGGGGEGQTFSNWNVAQNTIDLNTSGTIALGIQGQVQNSNFSSNVIQSDGSATNLIAIRSYSFAAGLLNFSNAFQDNHIDNSLRVDFSQDPNFNTNCRYQNRDLQGHPIAGFPDNSGSACK